MIFLLYFVGVSFMGVNVFCGCVLRALLCVLLCVLLCLCVVRCIHLVQTVIECVFPSIVFQEGVALAQAIVLLACVD